MQKELCLSSPIQIGSISPNRDVFLLAPAWFGKYFPFIDEKIYSIQRWNYFPNGLWLTISIPSTLSAPPSSPTLHLTCPCECSIYCNCIQHLALQTADKPAQGQLPTLTMFINRLFAQAYQSRYPQSLCGCLWTLCSLYRNRPPLLCEGGIRPSACSVRDQFAQKKSIVVSLKINNNDSHSLSLL